MKEDCFKDFPEEKKQLYMRNEFGFIAQELQETFPEVVMEDENGMLSVKYTRMIPILVEALKEQQILLDSLQTKLSEQQEEIINLQYQLKTKEDFPSSTFLFQEKSAYQEQIRTLIVYQNSPNPFHEETRIKCFIPADKPNVQLCIYDIRGICYKCVLVTARGLTEIVLQAHELVPGIYTYLLKSDGEVSEAKQMMITQ